MIDILKKKINAIKAQRGTLVTLLFLWVSKD